MTRIMAGQPSPPPNVPHPRNTGLSKALFLAGGKLTGHYKRLKLKVLIGNLRVPPQMPPSTQKIAILLSGLAKKICQSRLVKLGYVELMVLFGWNLFLLRSKTGEP